jgi:hypothetical protein
MVKIGLQCRGVDALIGKLEAESAARMGHSRLRVLVLTVLVVALLRQTLSFGLAALPIRSKLFKREQVTI